MRTFVVRIAADGESEALMSSMVARHTLTPFIALAIESFLATEAGKNAALALGKRKQKAGQNTGGAGRTVKKQTPPVRVNGTTPESVVRPTVQEEDRDDSSIAPASPGLSLGDTRQLLSGNSTTETLSKMFTK